LLCVKGAQDSARSSIHVLTAFFGVGNVIPRVGHKIGRGWIHSLLLIRLLYC